MICAAIVTCRSILFMENITIVYHIKSLNGRLKYEETIKIIIFIVDIDKNTQYNL